MTLNPIACNTKTSKTPTQEKGFEIIFSVQFPFRQTWSTDRFSFDTLILITRMLFLKQFWKSQLSMAKYEWNLVLRSWEVVIVRLGKVFETLSQRHSRRQRITEHEKCVHSGKQWWPLSSFQLPPETKGSPHLLSDFFEKNCDVLPVFGFRSASFDITLIQSYLLPIWTVNKIQNPWLSKKLSTASFSILLEYKLNQVSRRLSCAATVNLGFVFVLNSIQTSKFRVL